LALTDAGPNIILIHWWYQVVLVLTDAGPDTVLIL